LFALNCPDFYSRNQAILSFRPERADAFSFAFAPANASARVVEETLFDRSRSRSHFSSISDSSRFLLPAATFQFQISRKYFRSRKKLFRDFISDAQELFRDN
jgi:hypothetical protein